jgi:hypothetical protein
VRRDTACLSAELSNYNGPSRRPSNIRYFLPKPLDGNQSYSMLQYS